MDGWVGVREKRINELIAFAEGAVFVFDFG